MNKGLFGGVVLFWCVSVVLAGAVGGDQAGGALERAAVTGPGGGVGKRGGVGLYQWITAREILGKRGMR